MSATDTAISDDAIVRGEAPEQEKAATDAAREVSTAVEKSDFTLPARHQWDQSQVAVIRRTVAKDCDVNELAMFLEVAARYQLDPFTREIFAAKFNGSNGAVTIFAGRDGLLKAAKIAKGAKLRHMESHVVREMDEYEVVVDTETMTDEGVAKIRKLRHVRKGMGTGVKQEDGTYKGGRGPIIGAYALVWMEGEEAPWFAEATWEDYGAIKSGKDKSNWKTDGSGYTEAMMIKVPQSIALRMACGLAGLYSQEEVQKQLDERSGQNLSGSGDPTQAAPGVDWPDSELGATLQALAERANELSPGSWRTAKLAMRVNGKDEPAHEALAAELRRFIGQREPHDPLAQEPEKIVDAVVVGEDGEWREVEHKTEADREEDRIMQGVVSEAVVAAAHDNEQARILVQERLDQLREHYAQGTISDCGFDSDPDVTAEMERLESTLREATNGGETIAEAIEQEPAEEVEGEVMPEPEDEEPIEWNELSESELEDLNDLLPQLLEEVEKAADGSEEHRVLMNNYREAKARQEALIVARDAGAEAGE